MREITKSDLRTILLFAVHVAKADHEIVWEEREVLKKLFDILDLDREEKLGLLHERISLRKGINNLSSDTARTLLLKTLCAVAKSDKVVKDTELDFIEKVLATLQHAVKLQPMDTWQEYEGEVLKTLHAEFG